MEWMNVNVKFIKTLILCYLVGYTPHKHVEREDWYYTTVSLYSNNNAKTLSSPSMQEDYMYYTYGILCRELGYYMLPV